MREVISPEAMDAIKAKNFHFIDSSLFERDYVLFLK